MFRKIFSKSILLTRNASSHSAESCLQLDYLHGEDQGIAVLGLNSKKTRNSFNKELTQSMYSTIEEIHNSSVRVVILRSLVPKVFSAGADLKERLSMKESEVRAFVTNLRNLMFKIENIPSPVISAIDGAALGGGLEMALSCDIRIATESAKLGLVETKLAILPGAGGTQRLPRLIGPALAKELIFTGRILNGKQAKEFGLVNHCVVDNNEGNSAFLKALEIAREIIPNGPVGVKMAKHAVNRGLQVEIHEGCAIEGLCYDQVIPTKDRIEGIEAFLQKRSPLYTGE